VRRRDLIDWLALDDGIRFAWVAHARHEGQIGPDVPLRNLVPVIESGPGLVAVSANHGARMHYCGVIIEHRTSDPDFAGWCPAAVEWCGDGAGWSLASFEPLSLAPAIVCATHPHELHVVVANGRTA